MTPYGLPVNIYDLFERPRVSAKEFSGSPSGVYACCVRQVLRRQLRLVVSSQPHPIVQPDQTRNTANNNIMVLSKVTDELVEGGNEVMKEKGGKVEASPPTEDETTPRYVCTLIES